MENSEGTCLLTDKRKLSRQAKAEDYDESLKSVVRSGATSHSTLFLRPFLVVLGALVGAAILMASSLHNDASGNLAPMGILSRISQSLVTTSLSSTSSCLDRAVHTATFADMHDGDQKVVSIHNEQMTIQSASNTETWIVTAKLDLSTCTAMVDFNVPGKPSPPPIPLLVTVWKMERLATKNKHHRNHHDSTTTKLTLEFTDPSETIASKGDMPLNHWVQLV